MTKADGRYRLPYSRDKGLAVLFLIFCAGRKLLRVTGRDKLIHVFFGGRSNFVKEHCK
jgi:hypothetical protein